VVSRVSSVHQSSYDKHQFRLVGIHKYPEDWGYKAHWNTDNLLLHYTASHLRTR